MRLAQVKTAATSTACSPTHGRTRPAAISIARIANQIFKGWAISGITTYQKGLPFSVTDGNSGGLYGTASGTAQFRCNSIAEAYTQGTVDQQLANYLNPACFAQAPVIPLNVAINGSTANAGGTGLGDRPTPRNAFRAPYQQNWDMSLMKAFTIGEKNRIDFRMDVFNVFNHPVFTTPASVNIVTPSTFTQITNTAVPARLIQFGLKFSR
jgi:hypothetical protein